MGGVGSGARRSRNVGDVEDVIALDIRALRRLGVARVGECVCATVRWSMTGPGTPSARLRVDLSADDHCGGLRLDAIMPDGICKQWIKIEAVPTAYNGWRCYFICPINGLRSEVLYYASGRFASRKAQRLTYVTQNLTDLSRARRKVAKLCSRLEGSNGQRRPRGRNRIEVASRLRGAERCAKSLYFDRLSAAAGRSGARTGPKPDR